MFRRIFALFVFGCVCGFFFLEIEAKLVWKTLVPNFKAKQTHF